MPEARRAGAESFGNNYEQRNAFSSGFQHGSSGEEPHPVSGASADANAAYMKGHASGSAQKGNIDKQEGSYSAAAKSRAEGVEGPKAQTASTAGEHSRAEAYHTQQAQHATERGDSNAAALHTAAAKSHGNAADAHLTGAPMSNKKSFAARQASGKANGDDWRKFDW
jgi:hypothetical protein